MADEISFTDAFPQPTREAWRAAVDKVLKGADFEKRMVSRTDDGIRVEPLYSPDLGEVEPGVPGVAPFVRGAHVEGRWTIEQREAHPDPKTANRQALDDLARGVEAIRLAIADPLDPAGGGIGLASPDELSVVVDGVLAEIAPISLEAGSRGLAMARALLRLWNDHHDDPAKVAGDLNVDPLGTLLRTGRLPGGLDAAFADAAELVREVDGCPHVRTLGIDLRVAHDAGASPALELAVGLAQLASMVRQFDALGIDPRTVAAQTTFLVPVDDDVFQSIAKLRALRRVIATLIGACGVDVPAPRLAVETSRRMLAQRDPWVNLLRSTVAGFAGGVGGADTLTVLPFTYALGLPDASARRMSRNIQLVLLEEASLGHVADPAGGSWYVEHLTDELAKAAWQRFQAIETAGGFLAVVDDGSLLRTVDEAWAKKSKDLATRKLPITGVSTFPLLDERKVPLDETPPAKLSAPAATANDRTVAAWPRRRNAEDYERLRDAADALAAKGERPSVLLLNLGHLAEFNVRSGWIRSLVEGGGLAAVNEGPLLDAASVTAACTGKAVPIAVLCSSDKRYGELAVAAVEAAKAAGVGRLYLAGRQKPEFDAALRAAGVDAFLYQGMDVLAELEHMHTILVEGA